MRILISSSMWANMTSVLLHILSIHYSTSAKISIRKSLQETKEHNCIHYFRHTTEHSVKCGASQLEIYLPQKSYSGTSNSTKEKKRGVGEAIVYEASISRLTTRDILNGLNVTPHHENSPLDCLLIQILLLAWDVIWTHDTSLHACCNLHTHTHNMKNTANFSCYIQLKDKTQLCIMMLK